MAISRLEALANGALKRWRDSDQDGTTPATGRRVGAAEPPPGSLVTSTWSTRERSPGTSTEAAPSRTSKRLLGAGADLPRTSQTWYTRPRPGDGIRRVTSVEWPES